jgi:hypothetical protein
VTACMRFVVCKSVERWEHTGCGGYNKGVAWGQEAGYVFGSLRAFVELRGGKSTKER